jgi:hypothetical protein
MSSWITTIAPTVGVGGYLDLAAGPGLLEDCLDGCRLHAEVADVDGVVPRCLERPPKMT